MTLASLLLRPGGSVRVGPVDVMALENHDKQLAKGEKQRGSKGYGVVTRSYTHRGAAIWLCLLYFAFLSHTGSLIKRYLSEHQRLDSIQIEPIVGSSGCLHRHFS